MVLKGGNMANEEEHLAAASGRGFISIIINGGDIKRMFHRIMEKVDKMAGELEALRTEVQNNANVTQSAITLLQGLKAQLDSAIASGDMSQVQALSDQLGASDVNLAAAVTANTPQEPQPAPAQARTPQAGQPTGSNNQR
jgi:hypothetical protein